MSATTTTTNAAETEDKKLYSVRELLAANLKHVTERLVDEGHTPQEAQTIARLDITQRYQDEATSRKQLPIYFLGFWSLPLAGSLLKVAPFVLGQLSYSQSTGLFGYAAAIVAGALAIVNSVNSIRMNNIISKYDSNTPDEQLKPDDFERYFREPVYNAAQRSIDKRYGKPNSDPAATLG